MLNDQDRQRSYELMFDLYAHGGWKQLVKQAESLAAALENPRGIKSLDDLRANQGQLHILDWVIRHEATTNAAYAAEVNNQDTPTFGGSWE